MVEEKSKVNQQRAKQLRLFTLGDPLTERFGSDFFRSLPKQPGVYFFYGSKDELLYIGQSLDLRARIGSYRHVTPENNHKRTLRLIHRVAKIEWKECSTPEDAIELERSLLLVHQPPLNRAGVWKGDPWWLKIEATNDRLNLELVREEGGIGPLPSSFRYVLGSLVRCIYRVSFPCLPLSHYPHGLFGSVVPLTLSLTLPDVLETAESIRAYADGNCAPLLSRLDSMPPGASDAQQEYWQEELDRVRKYGAKVKDSI
jgi:hypothetical protein